MAVTYFMPYDIVIQDDATYQVAYAMSNNTGLLAMAPRAAAAALGIPFPYPSGDLSLLTKYILFYAPYAPGLQIGFPGPSGFFIDDTILQIGPVPSQPGVPASIWPADPNKNGIFIWSGSIIKSSAAGSVTNPPTTLVPMPQRRNLGGREMNGVNVQHYEGGSISAVQNLSMDGSRVPGGYGFIIRGAAGALSWTRNMNALRAGFTSDRGWDRFYFRLRNKPSVNDCGIFRAHGFPSAGAGIGIKIKTTGEVVVVRIDSSSIESSPQTLIANAVIDTWYKIDVVIYYHDQTPPDTSPGSALVYVNGVSTVNIAVGSAGGTQYQSAELGKYNSAADSEFEVDLDDWITSDWPANFSIAVTGGIQDNGSGSVDFLVGSHVRAHKSLSVSQVNWAPASGGLIINNDPAPEDRLGTTELTSSTSGATLEGLTDALTQDLQDSIGQSIGIQSAVVALDSKNSAATDGKLGYRLAGAAAVLTTIDQFVGEFPASVGYFPSGSNVPAEAAPLSVTHIKSTDANLDTSYFMGVSAEYIGIWGPEDEPSFNIPYTRRNYHNTRYANSIFSGLGSLPIAPVYAVGGTYVGNGSYQEITLPAPCHFLWIRGTTSGTSGIRFFGAANSPHTGVTDKMIPNVRMWYDYASGLYKFSVSGAALSECNVNAITYQYIAFCDPGMRFNICGAFGHNGSASTPKANALADSVFLPVCGFMQQDYPNTGSNSLGFWYKGPANTVNQGSPMDNTALEANFGSFSAGFFNSLSRLHSGGSGGVNFNYCLWRLIDSGIDPTSVMIQSVTYVGNGAGSQVVNLTPVSNRFPVFVLVNPGSAAGQSFFRDPSHSANNSSQVSNISNTTTGITAVAKDQITVGISLNANGVTYQVFSICGDTAGMNNGTFSPTYGAGAPANYVNPDFNDGVVIMGSGGIDFDGVSSIGIIKNLSGIYQLTIGKRVDTYQDTQTGQTSVDTTIPDPTYKTGYVGG